MEHARDLWNNWCGDFCQHYVKPAKNMQQAIKNCPEDFPQADWEWLVKEHFYSKEFISKAELIEKLKQSEDEKRAMQEENRELREENKATNSRMSRMEQEWEELKNRLSSS